ncbi:sugar phosphate nucleotidyltransferase [Patescibacteria group bacterium]
MKAIILASGLATRLKPLSDSEPKPLTEIGNETILSRILNSLIKNNVKEVVITTGYLEEKIKKYVSKKFPQIKVEFVFNPRFKETNYIYSMWLAKEYLKNTDVLYLHGDSFYDSSLIKKLIDFPHSGALIKRNLVSQKDFNALVKDGLITKIGVKVFGKGANFCLPVYKFLEKDWQMWMEKIDGFVEKKEVSCYAEDALNMVFDQLKFYPVYYDKEYGMEIDDLEDLKIAEAIIEKKI